MKPRQTQLVEYSHLAHDRGLTSGAGGNLSCADEHHLWITPTGFALSEIDGSSICCVQLLSGSQLQGPYPPSSELPMHLALYRACSDVFAVVHTHPPFASGMISSGQREIKPMFAEVVAELGEIGVVPYLLTSTRELADAVARQGQLGCKTIFMKNHGIVCLGRTLREAYHRSCLAEDAAKSYVAAALVGEPEFLTKEQIEEIKNLSKPSVRNRILGRD